MSANVLLPAFYFGSVDHYALMARSATVVIDIGEHYERQSYRTRTSIMGANGRQDLLVNIERRSGKKMPMRTVRLSYTEPWNAQHVQAIRSAYGQTPWYIHYIEEIEEVLLQKYDRLVDLDLATMRLALKWIGLPVMPTISETYLEAPLLWDDRPLLDLRAALHPKRSLPDPLMPIRPYPQVFADRHGQADRLSIIDLVMNTGPDARMHLR